MPVPVLQPTEGDPQQLIPTDQQLRDPPEPMDQELRDPQGAMDQESQDLPPEPNTDTLLQEVPEVPPVVNETPSQPTQPAATRTRKSGAPQPEENTVTKDSEQPESSEESLLLEPAVQASPGGRGRGDRGGHGVRGRGRGQRLIIDQNTQISREILSGYHTDYKDTMRNETSGDDIFNVYWWQRMIPGDRLLSNAAPRRPLAAVLTPYITRNYSTVGEENWQFQVTLLMMGDTPWNCLPNEIIENIIINVPAADMPFNEPWLCKSWTNILLQPRFWIRKLMKMNFIINEDIQSVLAGFERNIQTACLYYACLNEELTVPMKGVDLSQKLISDDFGMMLEAAGILVTRSVDSVGLILNKERIPVLNILLKLLAVRGSSIKILDYYGFWNFSLRYDYVQMLKGPNEEANIETLIGCVSTQNVFRQLGGKCRQIMLSIPVDEYNKAVDPGIYTAIFEISMIHIKAGIDISTIKHAKMCKFTLIVSGFEATHICWMTNLAKTLGLCNGYRLILCSCQLKKKSSEDLFRSLEYANIKPHEIMCASSNLNADDARQLNELAHRLGFDCDEEYFVLYEDNEKLMKVLPSSRRYEGPSFEFQRPNFSGRYNPDP